MPFAIRKHTKTYECVSNIFKSQEYQEQQHFIISKSIQKQKQKQIKLKSKKCAGVLKTIWNTENGQSISYSTAFAISPKIIVTCAHSVFDTNYHQTCTSAQFMPINDYGGTNQVYQTKRRDFLKFHKISHQTRYGYKPLRIDYAVLILDRPLQLQSYLVLSRQIPEKGDDLEIWGFPFQSSTHSSSGFQDEKPKEKGKYIKSKGDYDGRYILVHDIGTQRGHSGSPIVRYKNGQLEVLAMHTHKGRQEGMNEGLLMSAIRYGILNFAIQLLREHSQYEELARMMENQKYSCEEGDKIVEIRMDKQYLKENEDGIDTAEEDFNGESKRISFI